MLTATFGLEIEMTGITRRKAAEVTAQVIGGRTEWVGGAYDAYLNFGMDVKKLKRAVEKSVKNSEWRRANG